MNHDADPRTDADPKPESECRSCDLCRVKRTHEYDEHARKWECLGPCPDEYNPDHDPDFGIRRH